MLFRTHFLLLISCLSVVVHAAEHTPILHIPAVDDPVYQLKQVVTLSKPFSEFSSSRFVEEEKLFFHKKLPVHDSVRAREVLRLDYHARLNETPAQKCINSISKLALFHALHYRINAVHQFMDYYLGLKRFEMIAHKAQELCSSNYQVDPERMSHQALQTYHYHQTLFEKLFSGTKMEPGEFEQLLSHIHEIINSDDPELLKIALQPLNKQKENIDTLFNHQINELPTIRAKASSYELLATPTLAKMNPTLLELVNRIQIYLTRAQSPPLSVDPIGKKITLSTELEQAVASYAIMRDSYRATAQLLHQEVESHFATITSLLQKNTQLFALLQSDDVGVTLGDLCQMKQLTSDLEEKHTPLCKQRKPLFLLLDSILSFAATGIHEIEKISAQKALKQAHVTQQTNTQQSIWGDTSRIKQQAATLTVPRAVQPRKQKIQATDGSYLLEAGETDRDITIYSKDASIVAHLWKKRMSAQTSPSAITYSKGISQWLNDPIRALKKKKAELEKVRPNRPVDERYTSVIHTFPQLVDRYLNRYGSHAVMKSRKDDENDVNAYWIPGTLTIDEKKQLGIFLYIFDHNNICFHRLFEAQRKHEIFDCIESSGALNNYLISQNETHS